MRMVLEHVHSPDIVLKKMADWLKPGGQLVIVVPDISGFEAQLLGRYFYSLHLPNRLYHFSAETLNKYLEKHDLKINKIYHHRSDKDF
jgi:2-polyprenyl-3-methyl-5-hydroxy-6-metoxy-1,4-benzoquinol methylase